jgi:predicted membrane-bound spermidine synthase
MAAANGATMALIWHRVVSGRHYEVREAGRTRRLYTDGVFHSEFNPRRPVTGSVWDLLMLPAFFRPERVRRVLLLGVGGGTVIRQLQQFLDRPVITGIELNPVHLTVARDFFGVGGPDVALHRADALQWLGAYGGPRFDFIIDDLFGEAEGEPVRAIAPTSRWFETLLRPLARDGVLAMNFTSAAGLAEAGWFRNRRLRERLPAAFRLSGPRDHNVVGAFLREPATAARLARHLARIPELDGRRRDCRLRYRIRPLSV